MYPLAAREQVMPCVADYKLGTELNFEIFDSGVGK